MFKLFILSALVATITCAPPHFPIRVKPLGGSALIQLRRDLQPTTGIPEESGELLNVKAIPSTTTTVAPLTEVDAKKLINQAECYQNRNARYQFASDVDDHISDQTQRRQEIREGLAVKGMYSYSDGYVKRTVEYVADEKGYRIVRMESEPLDGPHVDLSGTASIDTNANGNVLHYKVQSVPVPGPVPKVVDTETREVE